MEGGDRGRGRRIRLASRGVIINDEKEIEKKRRERKETSKRVIKKKNEKRGRRGIKETTKYIYVKV